MTDENKVLCLECGRNFTLINNKHLASHGMSPSSYQEKHPGALLVSQSAVAKMKEKATKNNASRKGVALSPEVTQKMRENHKSTKGIKIGPQSEDRKNAASLRVKEEYASGKRVHHMLGKQHSEETKVKITNSLSGYKQTEEHVSNAQAAKAK
jgi:hypothetical protein